VQTLRCPRCGADLPSTASYCPKCGANADSLATLDSNPATPDAPAASQRNLLDTPALDQGRFIPGQILAERYRIVALLGKGGMGEVYRADDLRLSQPLAMKFLPAALTRDGAALARFHREVRVARQVSHVNVCRVFDVGESGGLPFLTMEYIDGEDLASLLKRIGRLPQDKAIEISRQLCAGLAAAHEAGVLHRDLKPANVMLDKRGKVRITDFGLAGVTTAAGDETLGGTPAYMAPEQLAGNVATEQSDIYALGLVLYEIFTGKRVFEGTTLAELIRQHQSSTPKSPAQLVEGLDPLVERVILRCLEAEPARRPRSALQVAAALPGGDPLAAALAAGETPSPEMVAAAGGEGVMQPWLAWSLLVAAVVVMAGIVALAPYSTDLGVAPAHKSLSTLEVKAQEIVEQAGYTDAAGDHASWFERNYDFMLYRVRNLPTPVARKSMAHAELGPLTYIYRQSPKAMAPAGNPNFRVDGLTPPHEVSGMAMVVLNCNVRLVGFWAVPPQVEPASNPAPPEPNWSQMLADTGLDAASLRPAESTWLPPMGFDHRYGWRGFYPEDPATEIQISAASYRGKPVYFHVIGPWTGAWRMQSPRVLTRSSVVRDTTVVVGGFVLLALAVVLARRNIRLGRGDRTGAMRISAFALVTTLASLLLGAHYIPDLGAEWGTLLRIVGMALLDAAILWVIYIALEPFIRRQWPELLISWTRLLAGGVRDPLTGRDLLGGILAGATIALGLHVANALPGWFNLPGETTVPANTMALGAPQEVLAYVLGSIPTALINSFFLIFTLFLARSVLRRYWPSVVATAILGVLTNLGGENFTLETPFALLATAMGMIILLRLGLLAYVVALFTYGLLSSAPLTLDFSRWYAPQSLFVLFVLLGMLVYGLRVATGNKPLLAE